MRLGRILKSGSNLDYPMRPVSNWLGRKDTYRPSSSQCFRCSGMSMPLLMADPRGSLYVDFQSRGPIYIKEVLKFIL